MKDSLSRVLISGLTAGLIMDVLDVILHTLKFSNYAHWDWASFVTLGYHTESLGEMVFGEITNLIFTMLLAVLFVFVISKIVTNDNLILRGIAFATGIWFVVNALAIMFRLPDLEITLGLAISNLVTAWIYGYTLTKVLKKLDNKFLNQ